MRPMPRLDALAREIQRQCRGKLKRDESLAKHTTFGLGGTADLFFAPADLDDLCLAVPLIKDAGLPIFPLGGGTNTLVCDSGFRGLVISLTAGARRIEIGNDEGVIHAGASTQVVARQCQRAGKTGLEFGCGIPGSIGGAIWGNAGAWGGGNDGSGELVARHRSQNRSGNLPRAIRHFFWLSTYRLAR